jgi:FMN phosphatase YigB (HAD superfamily)
LNWDEEQERLILEARLLASSPEAVFEELKKLSAKIRAQHLWTGDDKYEVKLIDRNERLINVGLASYGTNKEVLKALYKHGLEPAQDASEASYKEGLRIGLLSNNTAQSAHLLYRFPDEIIGSEETWRVVNEASNQ